MSNELTASKTRWSDVDKMKVLFGMVEAAGTIDWTKVPVPEGRTVEATKAMILYEKKKWARDNGTASTDKKDNGTPVEGGEAEKPARKRGPTRKKKAEDGASGENDGDVQGKAETETSKRKRVIPRKKNANGAENAENGADTEKPKRKRATPKKKAEAEEQGTAPKKLKEESAEPAEQVDENESMDKATTKVEPDTEGKTADINAVGDDELLA